MKKVRCSRKRILSLVTLALCLAAPSAGLFAECNSGLRGWDVLTSEYVNEVQSQNAYDGVTFQWDYFMVHDDDFTGSVGYVVANPRNVALVTNLMPTGASAAIAGKFLTGQSAGEMYADYYRFGKDGTPGPGDEGWYVASATERSLEAESGDGTLYGIMEPVWGDPVDPSDDQLILQGRTENFEWDLVASQDWTDRCSSYLGVFDRVTGHDVGAVPFPLNAIIKNEFWSVDMAWQRVSVTGTITNVNTEETFEIDGHGYRETAWGPWGFNYSGWDFVIAGDEASQVQWSLQTYHDSTVMDYLDVSFYDGPDLQTVRFEGQAGELGWYHDEWMFETETRQCLPRDMTVIAANEDYTVEAFVNLGADEEGDPGEDPEDYQKPMLSDLTPFTKNYAIVVRVASVNVTITRTGTDEVVASFTEKVGGGEFGIMRRAEGDVPTEEECVIWGGQYTNPLPAGHCEDEDEDGYGLTGGLGCPHPGVRDCSDGDPAINPGATEVARDGIDNDCDGAIDEQCATLAVDPNETGNMVPYIALYLAPLGFVYLIRRRFRKRGV